MEDFFTKDWYQYVDPDWFEEEQPQYYNSMLDGEPVFFDTCDDIMCTDMDDGLQEEDVASVLAMTEEINKMNFDVDEGTDDSNMQIVSMYSNRPKTKPLRPFEQYIDDICSGRRSLFE